MSICSFVEQIWLLYYYYYYFGSCWYRESVDNTVEVSSSKGMWAVKLCVKQNRPVLDWRCLLTQAYLYSGCKRWLCVCCFGRCRLWNGHHLGSRVCILQCDNCLDYLLLCVVVGVGAALEHVQQRMELTAVLHTQQQRKPVQWCQCHRPSQRYSQPHAQSQRRILWVSAITQYL